MPDPNGIILLIKFMYSGSLSIFKIMLLFFSLFFFSLYMPSHIRRNKVLVAGNKTRFSFT